MLCIAAWCTIWVTFRVETKQEVSYVEIACDHIEKETDELEAGKTEIVQECKNGKNEITEEISYRRGNEVERKKISETIKEQPQPEIKLVGTKQPVTEAQAPTSTANNQAQTSAPSQSTTNQNINYSNEMQHGYCKDGTPAYGNPHAAGRANVCYGHKGWVGN